MRYTLLLLLLCGCSTQAVQLCAIQPLKASDSVILARMQCQPEGKS